MSVPLGKRQVRSSLVALADPSSITKAGVRDNAGISRALRGLGNSVGRVIDNAEARQDYKEREAEFEQTKIDRLKDAGTGNELTNGFNEQLAFQKDELPNADLLSEGAIEARKTEFAEGINDSVPKMLTPEAQVRADNAAATTISQFGIMIDGAERDQVFDNTKRVIDEDMNATAARISRNPDSLDAEVEASDARTEIYGLAPGMTEDLKADQRSSFLVAAVQSLIATKDYPGGLDLLNNSKYDSWLEDNKRNALLGIVNATQTINDEEQEYMADIFGLTEFGPGEYTSTMSINPGDPKARKYASQFWEQFVLPGLAKKPVDEYVKSLTSFVEATGIVPNGEKNRLVSAFTRPDATANKKVESAYTMKALIKANPRVKEQFSAELLDPIMFVVSKVDAGWDYGAAVAEYDNATNQSPEERVQRKADYTTMTKGTDGSLSNANWLVEQLGSTGGWKSINPFADDSIEMPPEMIRLFSNQVMERYLLHGNLDASREAEMANITSYSGFSVTTMGGGGRFVRMSPEKAYFGRIAPDKLKEMMVDDLSRPGVFGKDFDPDRIRLQFVEGTDGKEKNGFPSHRYSVLQRGDDGGWYPVMGNSGGEFVSWKPSSKDNDAELQEAADIYIATEKAERELEAYTKNTMRWL